jgi:lysophospholipase L1-like esterase
VQIASGPTSGGLAFYFEGVIAYDGDKTSGVRCHNLAFPSCASNWLSPSANKLNTNIGRFCTGSGTGATIAKLVIVAIGANDCGTAANPNVDVATHIANVTAMVDSALSQPSKPCVMLLVYPWRCDAGGVIYGRSTSHPKDYISAAYQIASNRPDVCVVDLNRLAGSKLYYNSASDNSYVSMLSPSGWNDADLVHLHNNAQSAIANLLYAALSS